MKALFPASPTPQDQIQSRLLKLAALFVTIYALILTLSPAVRLRSWDVAYLYQHWGGWAVWMLVFNGLHRFTQRRLPERDPYLLPIAALLSGWGLLTIFRLNIGFGWRQAIWLPVCALVIWAAARSARLLTLLRRYKYLWLVGGLALTALTFIFGTYPGGEGPHLWLGWGVYLQPSEPLKLLLIVYLAAYLADRIPLGFSFFQLITPTILLVGAALAILVIQRDLGTASIFLTLYFVILYLATGKLAVLLTAFGAVAAAGFTGYQLFDVIRIRVDAWVNPWMDPSGRSYQIVQSLMAVASGGIIGRGPGLGNPGVVPVAHSDFIFAAIAEESGLAGTLLLFVLLGLMVGRSLIIALRAPNNYQRYLAGGLTAYLFTQSCLIIGGNLRLLPLTGVTLPFVSYGGSSLLTSFITILLLLSISAQQEEEPAPLVSAKPYIVTASIFFLGIVALGVINYWWTDIRSTDLLNRTDNPRRSINERYVQRGSLLDRANLSLASSSGVAGGFVRSVLYPALGPVLGYSNPNYGQAGLEAGLDDYLRGEKGNSSSTVWYNHMVYGTPPSGLNVRLSLDLNVQRQADELLGDHKGAVVLLNAQSGEILTMASHPYYDPNQLNEKWDEWIRDQNGPLMNRAVQGQYPLGTALGPFFLAWANSHGQLPAVPDGLSVAYNGHPWQCAITPTDRNDWGALIESGCPGAVLALGKILDEKQVLQLYRQLGFEETTQLPVAVATSESIQSFDNLEQAVLGQDKSPVTPLQLALAAATFTNHGLRPNPVLALSVEIPGQGWVVLPSEKSTTSIPEDGIAPTVKLLTAADLPIWQTTATAHHGSQGITWYIAGTTDAWKGSPLALVVLLEEDDPTAALNIGLQLFHNTLK